MSMSSGSALRKVGSIPVSVMSTGLPWIKTVTRTGGGRCIGRYSRCAGGRFLVRGIGSTYHLVCGLLRFGSGLASRFLVCVDVSGSRWLCSGCRDFGNRINGSSSFAFAV